MPADPAKGMPEMVGRVIELATASARVRLDQDLEVMLPTAWLRLKEGPSTTL